MKKLSLLLVIGLLAACAPEVITPTREIPTRVPTNNPAPVGAFEEVEVITSEGNWPSRMITVVVPFLAGGDTDMYARMLARYLSDILGQPVNVVNEDGGAGNIASTRVSTGEPDGYTVLFYHTGTMFVNLLVGDSYLTYTDFELSSVAIHCDAKAMVIRADLGINNAREFLSYIRENPKGLSLALVERTYSHIIASMVENAGEFDLENINVGSARLKAPSLLGGRADLAYNNIALFLDYIESGDMIALWVTSAERNPMLPDVPTLAEVGIRDGFIGRSYFFGFPQGTDEAIVRKFSDAVGQATENEEFRQELFDAVSQEPYFVPWYEVEDYMREAWLRYAALEDYMRE